MNVSSTFARDEANKQEPLMVNFPNPIIPAQAVTQDHREVRASGSWIPACAGMSGGLARNVLTPACAVVLLLSAAATAPAPAQQYPNRPITLVIPLPPGGSNDFMARAVADKMSAALGQRVVIENRASGGSGT